MDIWLVLKIQSLLLSIFSFFCYKIFSYLFLASIEKELGKPIRNHVIFFYVNAVMMRVLFLTTLATFFAVVIKDWL
jgi:hypothetical protein